MRYGAWPALVLPPDAKVGLTCYVHVRTESFGGVLQIDIIFFNGRLCWKAFWIVSQPTNVERATANGN